MGDRGFYRVGAYGQWYLGKFDFETFYEHGHDNVFLGNSVPANQPVKIADWCGRPDPGMAGLWKRITTTILGSL